jgi:hypothetical protein
MRTANRIRTPERAAAAQKERTEAFIEQFVDQLGQMRGRYGQDSGARRWPVACSNPCASRKIVASS